MLFDRKTVGKTLRFALYGVLYAIIYHFMDN
ncbi:hypothetical protein DEU40_105172 [Chryseobacterium sp. AG844]|nr:hypothetical protein DEU40_105172 [Chryseobacterium sp. AG844]